MHRAWQNLHEPPSRLFKGTLALAIVAIGLIAAAACVDGRDLQRVRGYPADGCMVLAQNATYVEDFEQLSVGYINGQSGPMGDWASSGSSQYNRVAYDSSNKVLDLQDTSSAQGYGSNAILTLDSPFTAVGATVRFKAKQTTGGVSVIYVYGSQINVQLYFDSGGSVDYENGGSLVPTGLTWQSVLWEEYEIHFASTSTSQFRQKKGSAAWSAWTVELHNRDHWDSTSAQCNKLWLSSGSGDIGHGLFDDFWFPESNIPVIPDVPLPGTPPSIPIIVPIAIIGTSTFVGIAAAVVVYNKKKGKNAPSSTIVYQRPMPAYKPSPALKSATYSSLGSTPEMVFPGARAPPTRTLAPTVKGSPRCCPRCGNTNPSSVVGSYCAYCGERIQP